MSNEQDNMVGPDEVAIDPAGEVGDNELVPETTADPDANLTEEVVNDDQEQTAEAVAPQKPSPADTEINSLKQQLGQMSQAMSNMYGFMQAMAQRPTQNAVPPAPPAQRPPRYIPDEVEGYSQKQLAQYALDAAESLAEQKAQVLQRGTQKQIQVLGEIVHLLSHDHPEYAYVTQAVQRMASNPGMEFADAFAAVKANTLAAENERLRKQTNRQQQFNQKKAQKAQQQSARPSPVPGKKVKYMTTEEAMRATAQEMGIPWGR